VGERDKAEATPGTPLDPVPGEAGIPAAEVNGELVVEEMGADLDQDAAPRGVQRICRSLTIRSLEGNTGQLTMVEIEPYDEVPPEVLVHRRPATEIKDISWWAEDQAGTPTTG
jgi:hypothetical protein